MINLFSVALAVLLAYQTALEKAHPVRLDRTEYIVSDTSKYESFRLHVVNDTDSLVIIERAQPSCGCILVTVQRREARRGESGDIYVAVTSAKIDTLQPTTVDVYTNVNRTFPMRLYIYRKASEATTLSR